ncbi:MAG: T9SS type A sorting domain-containing protein, partial [Bacteroidota bacterium]
NVYTDERWSDPFDSQGNLDVIPVSTTNLDQELAFQVKVYPNPATDFVKIDVPTGGFWLEILTLSGQKLQRHSIQTEAEISIRDLPPGIYVFQFRAVNGENFISKKVVKW